MRFGLALILSLNLVACATSPSVGRIPSGQAVGPLNAAKLSASNTNQVVKSPHGYVIGGPKERFGGFVGNCASDENFPYYWQCQSENAGHDFR